MTTITYGSFPDVRTEITVVPLTPDEQPPVPKLFDPKVAAHIERGRLAMRRLEEIFAKHPILQSQEVTTTFPLTLYNLFSAIWSKFKHPMYIIQYIDEGSYSRRGLGFKLLC